MVIVKIGATASIDFQNAPLMMEIEVEDGKELETINEWQPLLENLSHNSAKNMAELKTLREKMRK